MSAIELDALVEQHMPVARRMAAVAHRTTNHTYDVDDLIGEAYLSLVRAAQRWDGRVRFDSFAGWAIKCDLIDYLRIHGPCVRKRCVTQKPRVVSFDSLDLTPSGHLRRLAVQPDAPPVDYERLTRPLNERYRRVFDMYYAEGMTLREIGAEMGVNESRVFQILRNGLDKITRAAKQRRSAT